MEVIDADTHYRDGQFRTRYEVVVAAPLGAVRRLLNDYAHADRLSPIVRSSEVLARFPDGGLRLRLVTRPCVLFFCKTLIKVQDIEPRRGDTVVSHVVDAGHFRSGVERWRTTAADGGTRIIYQAEVRPDFFVPPLIGPWLIESAVDRLLNQVAETVERRAGGIPDHSTRD